jgi:hypothetical protein
MAKGNQNTKTKQPKAETPFRKFEALARKIVRVPKDKVQQARSRLAPHR